MNPYSGLAASYDALTGDVDYSAFFDFYKRIFHESGTEINSVLDLGCGTGTLTLMMAQNGYDMIAVDAEPEMLNEAAEKLWSAGYGQSVLLLNQRMESLDLYGTVDAAYSSLDCINYVSPDLIPDVLGRLKLFIRPGGLLIFDVISPEQFRSYDGQVFCDEQEDAFCVWRAEFDEERRCCCYSLDCFKHRGGNRYTRFAEEHIEYAHDPEWLKAQLRDAGFSDIRIYGDFGRKTADDKDPRLFYVCKRGL